MIRDVLQLGRQLMRLELHSSTDHGLAPAEIHAFIGWVGQVHT